MPQTVTASAAGTVALGDLTVNRLGYGAMRITGKGIWGPPADHAGALATLRRAVDLGVNFIDTADSYGPNVSEELIAEALFPYPPDLVIATKGGWQRVGPGQWIHNASPRHLQEAVEGSLKRLRVDRIAVYQLTSPTPPSPSTPPWSASPASAKRARSVTSPSATSLSNISSAPATSFPSSSVQNRYGFADREWDFLLDFCEQHHIAFIPWAPLGQNREANDLLDRVAGELNATPLQVALAWLLARSAVTLPIPGTSSAAHVEENVAAAGLELPAPIFQELTAFKARPPCCAD